MRLRQTNQPVGSPLVIGVLLSADTHNLSGHLPRSATTRNPSSALWHVTGEAEGAHPLPCGRDRACSTYNRPRGIVRAGCTQAVLRRDSFPTRRSRDGYS